MNSMLLPGGARGLRASPVWLIALVGYALAITSASVLALAAHIIVRMFLHVWSVVAAA